MKKDTARDTGRFHLLRALCGEFLHCIKLSLFDSACRVCGVTLVFPAESIVCQECLAKITPNLDPLCPVCGRNLGDWYERCGECLVELPPFRKHVSYSRYKGVLRKLILAYKYGGIEKLKFLFASYYIRLYHERVNESFDYIIAIPPDRSRKREFDHIVEMAKVVSQQLNIPLLTGHLVKIKKTLPQARLTRAKRLQNLNGAFQLKFPAHLHGKKVLLIDDVYTTGTTMRKCTSLLAQHHADVVAMTLAYS